jgi:hypothetical protein
VEVLVDTAGMAKKPEVPKRIVWGIQKDRRQSRSAWRVRDARRGHCDREERRGIQGAGQIDDDTAMTRRMAKPPEPETPCHVNK